MFGVSIGVRTLSVIFACCTWVFYDITLYQVKDETDEPDETEMKKADKNSTSYTP